MNTLKKLQLTLALIFCATVTALAAKPNIHILATGGTIAGTGTSATTSQYTAGQVAIGTLLDAVPQIKDIANVTGEQIVSIGSQDMNDQVWLTLANRINELLASPECDGIVVTHGTDTMEETAYFLNLTVHSDKPVVLTGAMRPSTAMSADGPLNLYNSVVTAASKDSYGRGVMIVMNGLILGAHATQKMNTVDVQTFQAPDAGPLGYVYNSRPYYNMQTQKRHTHTIASVTGLQDALNGKAASSHSHNYAGSGSAGGDANYADAIDVYSNISDYNANLSRNGLFSVVGAPSNGPGAGYGSLFQLSNVKNPVPGTSQHWISQLSFPTNNRIYYRQRVNADAWKGWSTVAFTSDLTWANIAGKPSTYAPSAHSHTIADVTGLQDALNGKAASSHTHSYLPLAGGIMSGTISFADLAGSNGRTLLQQKMADNDYFRIYVGGTATNAGFAEIATADDGNEPIYVRQYTGVFATLKRTLTLLDASGNTVCPGTVTAAGFAKSGSSDSYLLLGGGGHKAVSDFALSDHTHNYAAASHSHPSSQISDLIKKTAVGDIGWGTAANQQKALAMSAIAYWNGAYQNTSSNLQYCDRGRFGTIVTKGAGDYAPASHSHDYAASSHNHNSVYAPKAFSDFYEGANTVSTLASVPVTRRTVVATISANASFSLASTPAEGREVHIIVKNSGSADVTVAIPTTYIISGGEDTLSVPAGGYAEINVLSAGGKLYVRTAS